VAAGILKKNRNSVWLNRRLPH